ncbi:MAG: L-seryl-tRNA(Sec) selenium transferase [Chloroflexota bacterium]|nr:L-seryl-tRNA(Sec) selenium transferase [Chloroflexota bacterium]
MSHKELRKLPSIDRLLQLPEMAIAEEDFGHALLVSTARQLLDDTRQTLIETSQACPDLTTLGKTLLTRLHATTEPTLRPAINATGVIIHTNLGRAPLSDEARTAMEMVAAGYSNLEYDLGTGQRGSRYVHAVDLLCQLTGAEDALVINNNASAVLLCLMALARAKEVIISRGQLVEIGGGFRIPDVLNTSGARLIEVGTTNRTHLRDFQAAIGPDTAVLLRVHSSNFRQIGFTAEVSLEDLVELGHQTDIPVIDDLGSGTLLDTIVFGLAYEPRVQDSLEAGATLVTFSGDKLLGGPQAGLIVGKRDAIAQLRHYPLTRALRVDKTTLAALSVTLTHYLRGQAAEKIPVWRMIAMDAGEIARRSGSWAAQLQDAGVSATVWPGESTVGGGSLPGETLPTHLLALPDLPADRLAARLRAANPPIVARIMQDTLCLDPRTVLPEQDKTVVETLRIAAGTSNLAGASP